MTDYKKNNSKEINGEIIVILTDTSEIVLKELAKILSMVVSKVKHYIKRMQKSGVLETQAQRKRKWTIHK